MQLKEKLLKAGFAPKDAWYYSFIAAISVLTLAVVWSNGIVFTPDYGSYREHSIMRTPPLPLLLDLFSWLFGNFHLRAFTLFQGIFVLATGGFFVSVLREKIRIRSSFCVLIFTVLVSPLLVQQIANTILTEALAYGFFLLAMSWVVFLLCEFSFTTLAALSGLILCCMLVRPQLTSLWAGFVFLTAYIYLLRRDRKIILRGLLLLVSAFLLSFSVRSVYNYSQHGTFAHVKFGAGMNLTTDMLFVSEPKDLALFKDRPYYSAIAEIFNSMEKERLFAKDRFVLELPMATFFIQRSCEIGRVTMLPLYRYACGHLPGEAGFPSRDGKLLLALDKIQLDIYKTLHPLHYKDCFRLQFSRFSRNISPFELVFCGLAVLFLFLDAGRGLNRFGPIGVLVVFAVFMNVVNITSVSLVTNVLYRYTFYTELLELVFAVAVLDRILRPPNKLENQPV